MAKLQTANERATKRTINMRVFALSIMSLALVVAASAQSDQEREIELPVIYNYKPGEKCPGPLFYDDCNLCICLNDGQTSECTSKACPPSSNALSIRPSPLSPRNDFFPELKECTPGEIFIAICNTCICGKDGKGALCTRIACQEVEKRRLDDYENGKKCLAGKEFWERCNKCFCNDNGISASCIWVECIEPE